MTLVQSSSDTTPLVAYRAKATPIEAWKIDFDAARPEWLQAAFAAETVDWDPAGEGLWVNTSEGARMVEMGGMVVRKPNGSLNAYSAENFAAFFEPMPTQIPATDSTVSRASFDHVSKGLVNAKSLIVKLYNEHPEAREAISRATGPWFVWGMDRDAEPSQLPMVVADPAPVSVNDAEWDRFCDHFFQLTGKRVFTWAEADHKVTLSQQKRSQCLDPKEQIAWELWQRRGVLAQEQAQAATVREVDPDEIQRLAKVGYEAGRASLHDWAQGATWDKLDTSTALFWMVAVEAMLKEPCPVESAKTNPDVESGQ